MTPDGFVIATEYHGPGSFIVWQFPRGRDLKEVHSELRFVCGKNCLRTRLNRMVDQI